MVNNEGHNFHIPVLGIGYSVDTPLKVAKYGISSVISLVDDTLLERLRKYYLLQHKIEYKPISDNEDDVRARRITAYLNMVDELVKKQFKLLRESSFGDNGDLDKYFELLPANSQLKILYQKMTETKDGKQKLLMQNELRKAIKPGSIDVNIMTKLDKTNYNTLKQILPVEFNDAHSALRGYALSNLESKIIFSAGMNPRLFSYLETFMDFYPAANGFIRKKIVLKVSDFRSASIQGKFLAKKGLWVSEYRIESGLNCGGHAFATDGFLLGPILEEFKIKKDELVESIKILFNESLEKKHIYSDTKSLTSEVTVQGGVGKSTEQDFLIRKYGVNSVGWGTPFMLAPDVVNIDSDTLYKLSAAKEDDLYLSGVSPLGVPFNNLRNNGKDLEKMQRANNNKPGSPCPKKFLVSSNEFSEIPECTASISYLNKKIREIKKKFPAVDDFKKEYEKIVEKVCLCVGLTASTTNIKQIEVPKQSNAVSVCPGPNMAYFSKITNLFEMVDHIYGRINLITDSERPNMFIKELKIYIDYLTKKMEENVESLTQQTEVYVKKFADNISAGIEYYKKTIPEILEESEAAKIKFMQELESLEIRLQGIMLVFAH